MVRGKLKNQSSKARCLHGSVWTLALVMLAVTGCRPDPTVDPLDPFADRKPGRFTLLIHLDKDPAPSPKQPARCDVPIKIDISHHELDPEENLHSVLSCQGEMISTQSTNTEGFASHNTDIEGRVVLELISHDKLLQATFPVDLTTQQTSVYGRLIPDQEDLDGDGSNQNWIIVVDVISDTNADFIADDGQKNRWIFSSTQTIELRHLGKGVSARITQKSNSNETDTIDFSDRDGDFIPDDKDTDADGDTILDDTEPKGLSCPGFLHEELTGPTNKHDHLRCTDCHQATAYYCDDCHSPLGKNWIGSPSVDQVPTNHFQRECGQCHRADQSWSASPGPGGDHHAAYPVYGVHLTTSCFACHVTGNLKGISKECEGCHLDDSPEQHAKKACNLCHGFQSWNPPAVDHSFYPLSGGHKTAGCSQCHGEVLEAGVFEKPNPNRQCSTCHVYPQNHFSDNLHGCDICHIIDGWTPPSSHRGDPPNTIFDYTQWSTRWFPVPHLAATKCRDCHTQLDSQDGAVFFNCTTSFCHGGANEPNLNQIHNNGQDMGTDPSTQFHLYFFSANDPNAPKEWPSAHTGCVSIHCHSNGRRPSWNAITKD